MDTPPSLSARLMDLQRKHRALDEEISLLSQNPFQNQLLLQRLKKEKLRIKDNIAWIKNAIIPDLDA